MSYYRALAGFFSRRAARESVVSWPVRRLAGPDGGFQVPVESVRGPPAAKKPSGAVSALRSVFGPAYYRMVRGPYERWQMASIAQYCRQRGLMFDDLYSQNEPVVERACQMLPKDLATGRLRRTMRATHLDLLKLYLPLPEQNYDPFIPYLAPFIEEAKFQLQEEMELLGYHMWDRRLFSGGVTGLGETEAGIHFLCGFPNMYGAGQRIASRKPSYA